jgi:hypothetical protein
MPTVAVKGIRRDIRIVTQASENSFYYNNTSAITITALVSAADSNRQDSTPIKGVDF